MNNKKGLIAAVSILGITAIILVFLILNNRKFEVSFDTDGGTIVEIQKIKRGKKATKPSNPTKEGYTFKEWQYENQTYDFNASVEKSITLKAIWESISKYKVTISVENNTKTYEANGTSELNEAILSYEEKDGYILKWYVNGTEYDLNTPLTGDITVEGKYEKVVTYTVTFNTDGGSKIPSQKIVKNKTVKEPDKPKKEGYVLDDWYLKDKPYDFNTKVTKDITLVAKWIKLEDYTITFDTDGGSTINAQKITGGSKLAKPTNPTKDGYTFKEWQLNGKKYDFNTKISKNITLKAVWTISYTVTFDTDGGSSVASQTVFKDAKVTKPNNPTKSGYVLKEWQLNGATYDFNTKVTSDITLKAVWVKSYTVTFNTDGGNSITSQKVNDGSKATKPSNPTKAGYTFKEWQLNGATYSFDTAITSDITLKAVWVKSYTVTFDSNGGSTVSSQKLGEGSKATKPSNPTKAGYTFKEWQLNGVTYSFDTAVTSDITLKAVWLKSYTVTFDSNGGSSVSSQKINEGSKATKPSNPTRSGYTFTEWQLNGTTYDFNTSITGNITLKAAWTKNKTYTIKINQVDKYSPDVTLTVYENDTKISVSKIKFTDGVVLCGSNTTVYKEDISGETKFIVVLTNGTEVTATVVD